MAKSLAILPLLLVLVVAGCAGTGASSPHASPAPESSIDAQKDCHPELPRLDVKRTGGTAPRVISRVEPIFPREVAAERQTVRAVVILETVVDTAGNVADVCPVGGDPRFVQAAIDAVRRWKFEPATVNGQPLTLKFNLTVQFKLN